ncbi:hypothetical protein Tco_0373948 [Tanacetum coccineum]
MKKVIKEELEKLGFLMINDNSFACNTPLGTLCDEFNRLSGIDEDLFTYEVVILELASIPYDLKEEDNSDNGDLDIYEPLACYDENDRIYAEVIIFVNKNYKKQFDEFMEIKKQWMKLGSDVDMKYDPSNTRGDDKVELTNEESSDPDDENLIEENEVAKIFRIKTNDIK